MPGVLNDVTKVLIAVVTVGYGVGEVVVNPPQTVRFLDSAVNGCRGGGG